MFNLEEAYRGKRSKLVGASNTFQNRKVSSADALATVVPSGFSATCNGLLVWPLSSPIFYKDGYFHRHKELFTNPCDDSISLSCGFHFKAHIWLSVCILLTSEISVSVCQNLIVISREPPPEASKFDCQGHQAKALTADLC